jgi:predicted SnoaL-like aldol condensation-catalyzing enzyme
LVFEQQGKDPKDPSQPIFAYSFDLLRMQNGKVQEHWDSARKQPGSAPFILSTAAAPSTWNTTKPTMTEQHNLAIARRFEKDVVEYGHTEYIDELLSPSFIEHNPGVPADRAGLAQFWRSSFTTSPIISLRKLNRSGSMHRCFHSPTVLL